MQSIRAILPFLLKRMNEGRLAFFIGAGISAAEAQLPSGDEIRKKLLAEMDQQVTSTDSLPEVAQRYEEQRDRPELVEFLEAQLRFNGDISYKDVCFTYKTMLELPVDTILTTNFDQLIEECARVKGVDLRVYRTNGELSNYRRNERKLLKIHGDFGVPPTDLVITSDDYESYTRRKRLFCRYLENIFLENTVVFLGFALEDSDFLQIYQSVLAEVGDAKKKSYAVLRSLPSVEIQERWKQQKVQIVKAAAKTFIIQLKKAHKKQQLTVESLPRSVQITREKEPKRPVFHKDKAPFVIRKSFAYFIARRKAQLANDFYAYCTVDTLQKAAESTDPSRPLGAEVLAKADEVAQKLRGRGFYPEVLPPLDRLQKKQRHRKIEGADFCVILISSMTYRLGLNQFYGPIAKRKPILTFVHENLRSKLDQDLLFAGLINSGASIELFKKRDLASCTLSSKLEEIIDYLKDTWLIRAIDS